MSRITYVVYRLKGGWFLEVLRDAFAPDYPTMDAAVEAIEKHCEEHNNRFGEFVILTKVKVSP